MLIKEIFEAFRSTTGSAYDVPDQKAAVEGDELTPQQKARIANRKKTCERSDKCRKATKVDKKKSKKSRYDYFKRK